MVKALAPLLITVALSAAAAEPCEETRRLHDAIKALIRVEVASEQLRWEELQIAELRRTQERQTAELARFEGEVFSEEDLARLEAVNPREAEQQRAQAGKNARLAEEARRNLAATSEALQRAEKRIQALLALIERTAKSLDTEENP